MIDLTRICKTCKVAKPLQTHFYAHPGCRGGYRPKCKACDLAPYRKVRKTARQRLEEKFYITPGCWVWTAALDDLGLYGSFGYEKRVIGAHRASYQIYVGDIPPGMMVCHTCDNPRCVNPSHLFLGTATDNNSDRQRKGRTVTPDNRGERNGQCRLQESEIREIKADSRQGDLIAKQYGISAHYVRQIKRGERWKHIQVA